jgi:hypothetical protein
MCKDVYRGAEMETITKSVVEVAREIERVITHEEARQAILALVDEHFNNEKRRTQFSIPAQEDDTDVLLMAYIRQQEQS